MTGRWIVLWILRIASVGFLTFAHIVLFAIVVSVDLDDLQGPNGQDPVPAPRHVKIESFQSNAIGVLSWPILEPYTAMTRELTPARRRSAISGALGHVVFLGNSLVWGVGIWAMIELVFRALVAVFRARPPMT